MTEIQRRILVPPLGYRAREAGLFAEQLDDQSRRLAEATRGIEPAELAWQPAPGLNTIGMLLAHIAIVEVYWTQVGPLSLTTFETESVLGIGVDHDGMPLAAGGSPPAGLEGRELAYFDDLLARARAYLKRAVAELSDADLEREVPRKGRDGTLREILNLRWILYHMLEHEACHYGQINLLAHHYRLAGGRG